MMVVSGEAIVKTAQGLGFRVWGAVLVLDYEYEFDYDYDYEIETVGGLRLNRPLVWVAASFTVGMLAAVKGWCPGVEAPFFVCAVAIVAAIMGRTLSISRPVSVVLAGIALGAIIWNAQHTGGRGDELFRYVCLHPREDTWRIQGTVRLAYLEYEKINFREDTAEEPTARQFLLDVDQVSVGGATHPLHGGVVVYWRAPDAPVFATERVEVQGRLEAELGRVNPGVDSYEGYLRQMGVHTAISVRGRNEAVVRVAPGRRWSPVYWASRFRFAQTRLFERAIPDSARPFANMIWLGYRSTVSQEMYQAYINSGTVHILSVSGVHMAIAFGIASFVLRLFTRKRRVITMGVLVVIVVYTLMSGIRPSALRSAVMIFAYLAADFFGRERDAPTALSLSALVLLGLRSDILFDVGFQLSFLSVASILLFSEPINQFLLRLPGRFQSPTAGLIDEKKRKKSRWTSISAFWPLMQAGYALRATVATSLAVQVLPTPFALRCFNVFSFGAVFANLFIIPLAAMALWLCFAVSLSGLVSDSIPLLFGHALELVVGLINAIVELNWPHVTLATPAVESMVFYYGAVLCAIGILYASSRRAWWPAFAVCVLLVVVLWRPYRQEPTVDFLDVGHGDATFARWRDGTTFLVDGGDLRKGNDVGARVVSPFLLAHHVTHLSAVAVSHADSDHIGGLLNVVQTFSVGEVWLGPVNTGQALERDLLKLCAARQIPVRRLAAGDTVSMGAARIEVLYPPRDASPADSINNLSLVLRLDWEEKSILLTGDIEALAEAELIRRPCHADILKAPHHGSKTSSSEAFITAVHPKDCIISTGGLNGREHADEDTLMRYCRHGICLWRTDILGGIQVTPKNGLEGARQLCGIPCAEVP